MKKVYILFGTLLFLSFLCWGKNTSSFQSDNFIFVEGNQSINDFYINPIEVSQKLYKKVMGFNPSKHSGKNFPVEYVSFYDAICFCNQLSIKNGLTPCYSINGETDYHKWNYEPHFGKSLNNYKQLICDFSANGYRLPTLDEWIYAAKGGKNDEQFLYAGSSQIDEVSWYKGNSYETHKTGSKKSNALGIFDMSGNVFEWVWDSFQGTGDHRYYRGGSFKDYEYYSQIFMNYDFYSAAGRYEGLGIRVVRTKTQQ